MTQQAGLITQNHPVPGRFPQGQNRQTDGTHDKSPHYPCKQLIPSMEPQGLIHGVAGRTGNNGADTGPKYEALQSTVKDSLR
eukprot:5035494-Karenia_brevis.AAC.1